jgi:hypothetical protein
LGKFSHFGQLFTLGAFFKITEIAQNLGAACFHGTSYVLITTKNSWATYILGDFFKNSSGHPEKEIIFSPDLPPILYTKETFCRPQLNFSYEVKYLVQVGVLPTFLQGAFSQNISAGQCKHSCTSVTRILTVLTTS